MRRAPLRERTTPARAGIDLDSIGTDLAVLCSLNLDGSQSGGLPPKFLKPSPRTVLYREQDVVDWLEESERSIT
jgi:hypothetical protein